MYYNRRRRYSALGYWQKSYYADLIDEMSENRDHARMGIIERMRKKSDFYPAACRGRPRKRRVQGLPCGRIPFIAGVFGNIGLSDTLAFRIGSYICVSYAPTNKLSDSGEELILLTESDIGLTAVLGMVPFPKKTIQYSAFVKRAPFFAICRRQIVRPP